MNCSVFLFTRNGLIYSSVGLSSPGLTKIPEFLQHQSAPLVYPVSADGRPALQLSDTLSRRHVVIQRSFLRLSEVWGGSWEDDATSDDGAGDGVCVSVYAYFSSQRTRSGDISLFLFTLFFSQMNWWFMIWREDGLVESGCHCTWGDRGEGYSTSILEVMNLILASVHLQGEGDMSLVLAVIPTAENIKIWHQTVQYFVCAGNRRQA